MIVSIVVAVSENWVIGRDNRLLWKLSEDLKIFKKRTSGHAIIMGRKTYDSIGKALPNRLNIVVSKNSSLIIEGCEIANSLEMALAIAKEKSKEQEVFIIGGEMIYNLALDFANKIYLTRVKTNLEGDAFFDERPYANWQLISKSNFEKDEKNEFDFEILELKKS